VFYGNEFRIKQLITILLDNAIKFTGEGGKIILKLKCMQTVFNCLSAIQEKALPKNILTKFLTDFTGWTNPVHETTEARDWAWPLPNA